MKKILVAAAVFAIGTVIIVSCNDVTVKTEVHGEISKDSLVARGKYLVTTMGCGDCHSPKAMGPFGPEEDTTRLLSGHPSNMPTGPIDTTVLRSWMLFNPMLTAIAGPWGMSFSANLTSDSTGIGNWTEAQFFTAIRKGKSKGLEGNRNLLPPMPWFNYAKLTDADLKAIFAFLKSTRPIKNVVPAPVPPTALNKKV